MQFERQLAKDGYCNQVDVIGISNSALEWNVAKSSLKREFKSSQNFAVRTDDSKKSQNGQCNRCTFPDFTVTESITDYEMYAVRSTQYA